MSDRADSGSLVMLSETLIAGFASYDNGTTREFAAFEFLEGSERPSFVRICSPDEKKKLKKIVFGQKAVQSVRHPAVEAEDEYLIFHIR